MQTIDCKSSSNIAWARYREFEQVLEIDFKDKNGVVNSTYEYRSFSAADWDDFLAADSKGKHFAYRIRNARDAQNDLKFPARRIK